MPPKLVTPRKDARLVHNEIRKIAEDIAGAYYEHAASKKDWWYKMFPDQKKFIKKEWPKFVMAARQSLGKIVAGNYDARTKEQAYDILIQDSGIPYSPKETQILNVPN